MKKLSFSEVIQRVIEKVDLQSFFSLHTIFPHQNIFLCLYIFPTMYSSVPKYWLLGTPSHTSSNFSWPSPFIPRSTLNGIRIIEVPCSQGFSQYRPSHQKKKKSKLLEFYPILSGSCSKQTC